MEGITGYVFRNVYEKVYGNIDKYFTPFIIPTAKRKFKKKELKDILPDNNKNIEVIPQILTNNSEDFIRSAYSLRELGYNEVNLNLGCPSGTVFSKGRGAGFLARPDELNTFLDNILMNWI